MLLVWRVKLKRVVITATVYDKKGHILACENNSYVKTHPTMYKLGRKTNYRERVYLHAEVAAIIKAQKHGQPYKIKVERYDKNGHPKMAAPCPICSEAIRIAGIKFIEYTVG